MKSENESFNYSGVYFGVQRSDSETHEIVHNGRYVSQELDETSKRSPYGNCLVDHSGRQFVCFHEQCMEHNICFKNELLDENMIKPFCAIRYFLTS
jgi:hypothetical protein